MSKKSHHKTSTGWEGVLSLSAHGWSVQMHLQFFFEIPHSDHKLFYAECGIPNLEGGEKMEKTPEEIGEEIGRMLARLSTPASEFKKLADDLYPLVQEDEKKWAGVYQLALMSAGMRVKT